jgi:hypothetical protein
MRPSPSAADQHQCAATGCTRQIAYTFLMCRDHWRQLQTQTADGLYFAWASYRNAPSAALGRKAQARMDTFLAAAQQQIQAANTAATKP